MLTTPAYTEIEGVTIYGDDALFYKFYPIPQAPSIRLDKNGKPIFLLVKYSFSDDERANNQSLPPGGGYLNFDIDFSIPPALLGRVHDQLQVQVNQEWERLRNGTSQERSRVASMSQAPAVEFGAPTYTDGAVTLSAPDAPELVTGIITEGAPSLLAGNIAVFNLDLTSAGASFMERVLVSSEGAGETDLTPIQVRYDLKFWARLPSVRINVKADSQKIYDYVRKQMEGRGVDYCTTYDFQNTDIDTTTASVTGAIDVQIDTGSGSLPDSVIQELREYSLELVKDMVQSKFFNDEQPEHPKDNNADSRPHTDYATYYPYGGNTKKYLRQTYENTSMHIEFNLEQHSVIEWKIHPQSTLETFFKGMSKQELKQFVRPIRLQDDFFQNLNLTVRTFANFDDQIIDFVEVQVKYEGTENGEHIEKSDTFTFTSLQPQVWKPQLIDGKRDYQYRYRVQYRGQEPSSFSDWSLPQSAPDLNISLIGVGRLHITALLGDVNFADFVENVQVRIGYQDADQAVPYEESVLTLMPTVTERLYERLIYKPVNKKAKYQARFKMKSGEVREDAEWHDVNGPQILINQPSESILRVNLMPSGNGWDDVVQVIVDMYYEDTANQFTTDGTFALRSRDESKMWQVFLRNKNLRTFQYRTNISYKNGAFEQSNWQTIEDKTTVPVIVNRSGFRIVLVPDALDFGASPVTEVTTRYKANGFTTQETFVFTKKEPQVWIINVPKDNYPLEFYYQVTHNPPGQLPVSQPEVLEKDTIVVLPAYRPSKPGTLNIPVLGTLVDFAATPIVIVDLRYDDDQNQVHKANSLTFTERGTQSWSVDLKDINQNRFGYKITYFTTDGAEYPLDLKYQDSPRVIIPKFIS